MHIYIYAFPGPRLRPSEDNKFTPTKRLTPTPNHSSRPASAHTGTETPLQ